MDQAKLPLEVKSHGFAMFSEEDFKKKKKNKNVYRRND